MYNSTYAFGTYSEEEQKKNKQMKRKRRRRDERRDYETKSKHKKTEWSYVQKIGETM